MLSTPQFDYPFILIILMVDASDIGAGTALIQKDHRCLEHPIAYFSRKFIKAKGITV